MAAGVEVGLPSGQAKVFLTNASRDHNKVSQCIIDLANFCDGGVILLLAVGAYD